MRILVVQGISAKRLSIWVYLVFVMPQTLEGDAKAEMTQKLQAKLNQGLAQYNLTVSQDTDVPYANVIGFMIPIADIKLLIKNALNGGAAAPAPEAPAPVTTTTEAPAPVTTAPTTETAPTPTLSRTIGDGAGGTWDLLNKRHNWLRPHISNSLSSKTAGK